MAKSAEFILEPDQKQLLVLEPWGPSFEAVIRVLSEKEGLQVVECSTITELISVAKQISYCVILGYCADTADSERYKELLKSLQDGILAKKVRVIIGLGVTKESQELKATFFSAGASEVFQEPLGERVLASKVEYATSLLLPRKVASKRSKSDLSDTPSANARSEKKGNILWISPLGLESDCWITLREGIKQIAGKWLIPMMGPLPRYGQWCPLEAGRWEWVPSLLLDDPFIKEEGAWVFNGECPEFRSGSWNFTGREPELVFIYRGEPYGTKVSTLPASLETGADPILMVAEDSARAKALIERVEKSRFEKTTEVTPSAAYGNVTSDAVEEAAVVEIQKPYLIVGSLEIPSDCFAREERIPRFINGSWVVKLSGPTPLHGGWQRAQESEVAGEAYWKWVPSERDTFIPKPQGSSRSAWVFQGSEPSYRDGLWTFGGKSPRLDFMTEFPSGRVLARKVTVDSRDVFLLAEDSPAGLAVLEKLQSFRKKPPRYLNRRYGSKAPTISKGLFADAPVHPIAAAFFISESMRKKSADISSILKSYCAMLSHACEGGVVEPWVMEDSKWKCLSHGDLMDMGMSQKIEAIPPSSAGALAGTNSALQTRVIESGDARVVVCMSGDQKLGLLYFSGDPTRVFKEAELRAYARACAGVWLSRAA